MSCKHLFETEDPITASVLLSLRHHIFMNKYGVFVVLKR